MNTILLWDIKAFFQVNNALSNNLFDTILPLLRNKYFWIPLYIFLISFFIINLKRRGWIILFFLIIAIALSDQISSSVIKPLVQRIRPCNDQMLMDHVRLLVKCGSGYSFPSSHAANHFTIAFFIIAVFRNKWKWIAPLFIIWAGSISFAQVYVGVHYPLDVTGGFLIGLSVGFACSIPVTRFMQSKTENRAHQEILQ